MAERESAAAPAIRVCEGCGGQLPASFLSCPSCNRLVHAEQLKRLAAEAEAAERAGAPGQALAAWRLALDLLPQETAQHARVLEKVRALSALVPASEMAPPGGAAGAPAHRSGRARWAGGLGALGLLLAKFKWALLFLLGKGKLLLVGLTQAKTFLSMAIALGVYTMAFGWRFALGLILSIYVHEMGHVFWLRRYGIAATAPMFIPGFGAFVRLKQHPASAIEDARVGLAGPIWGAGAAIAALFLGVALHHPILMAIARAGAWINLFNLLPLWQLDGGRGFAALSRPQRALVAGVMWLLALAGADGVFYLLAIAATFRAAGKGAAPAVGDRGTLVTYLMLALGLAALMAAAGGFSGGHGPRAASVLAMNVPELR